jgi:hypothetical protein
VELVELQAPSTRAAVATPAISVRLRARSTCSPFRVEPAPGRGQAMQSGVNADEPKRGTLPVTVRSRDPASGSVTESCSKSVFCRKSCVAAADHRCTLNRAHPIGRIRGGSNGSPVPAKRSPVLHPRNTACQEGHISPSRSCREAGVSIGEASRTCISRCPNISLIRHCRRRRAYPEVTTTTCPHPPPSGLEAVVSPSLAVAPSTVAPRACGPGSPTASLAS